MVNSFIVQNHAVLFSKPPPPLHPNIQMLAMTTSLSCSYRSNPWKNDAIRVKTNQIIDSVTVTSRQQCVTTVKSIFFLTSKKSHGRSGGVSTFAGQHSDYVSMTSGTETAGKKQHVVTNKAEPAVQHTGVGLKSKVDHKTDAALMWLM